jgi:hypothetical protein
MLESLIKAVIGNGQIVVYEGGAYRKAAGKVIRRQYHNKETIVM